MNLFLRGSLRTISPLATFFIFVLDSLWKFAPVLSRSRTMAHAWPVNHHGCFYTLHYFYPAFSQNYPYYVPRYPAPLAAARSRGKASMFYT